MKLDSLPVIENRKEMEKTLNVVVTGEGDEDLVFEEEEPVEVVELSESRGGKKNLKAIAIESNSPIEKIKLEKYHIKSTKDPDLKILRANDNSSICYLDMLDERYWVIYSLDASQDIKRDIRSIVQQNNSRLDYLWLSSSSLKTIGADSKKTSFSLKFNNLFNNDKNKIKKFSMRIWSEDASEILDEVSEDTYISKAACVSNIGVVYNTFEDNYVKTSLTKDGCFSIIKATSINDFFEYKNKTIEGHYKPIIEEIESDYRTSYSVTDDGINIKGGVCSIRYAKTDNLEALCSDILKGKIPYRMAGYVNKIADDHFLLNVIDLHTYDVFDLEVFEDEMLINLPEGSCGNAVTRLFTLCQCTIDPNAKLMGDSRAII